MASLTPEWIEEDIVHQFRSNLDILEKITDGIEDPITQSALSGVHDNLCKDYAAIMRFMLPELA